VLEQVETGVLVVEVHVNEERIVAVAWLRQALTRLPRSDRRS